MIMNRISAILGERRENITTFARNVHISYPAAHDLYHNKSKSISFEMLNKICNYFELTPNDIFTWKKD